MSTKLIRQISCRVFPFREIQIENLRLLWRYKPMDNFSSVHRKLLIQQSIIFVNLCDVDNETKFLPTDKKMKTNFYVNTNANCKQQNELGHVVTLTWKKSHLWLRYRLKLILQNNQVICILFLYLLARKQVVHNASLVFMWHTKRTYIFIQLHTLQYTSLQAT